MNVLNRLKKMESQIIKEDSEFCSCPGEIQMMVIYPTLDGEGCGDSPPLDEKCRDCGKAFFTDTLKVYAGFDPERV